MHERRHIEAQAKRMGCRVSFTGDDAKNPIYRNGVWIGELQENVAHLFRQVDFGVFVDRHGNYRPTDEATAQEILCAKALLDWVAAMNKEA